MGREVTCAVRAGGKRAEAKVLLETEEVIIRGELRRIIPFRDMARVEVTGDALHIATAEGDVVIDLGAVEAAKWAERIRNPPTLLSKLGVKPDQRIDLAGAFEAEFVSALAAAGADVAEGGRRKALDLLFVRVDDASALAKAEGHAARIAADGAVWVVHRKGKDGVRDTDVMTAFQGAGLTDTKVCRFSETHSALKFVVPKAKR